MSGLFNNVGAEFVVQGEVTGKRHWKSDKSERESWYLIVAGKGFTYEVEVSKVDQELAINGSAYRLTGQIGVAFNKLVLIADKVEAIRVGAVPSRAAS